MRGIRELLELWELWCADALKSGDFVGRKTSPV